MCGGIRLLSTASSSEIDMSTYSWRPRPVLTMLASREVTAERARRQYVTAETEEVSVKVGVRARSLTKTGANAMLARRPVRGYSRIFRDEAELLRICWRPEWATEQSPALKGLAT